MKDFKELREALESISKAEKRAMDLPMFPVRYAVESVEFAMYDANQAFIKAANPATIRSLLAELDEARRHAGRYLWLRDIDSDPACSLVQLFTTTGLRGDVDAAIDAAMKEQQP